MDLQERLYTIEEYLAITRLPANENKRLELVDGRIVEKGKSERRSPSDRINTVIAAIILAFLNVHVLSKNIGYVSGADGGYHLGGGKVRLPDVAYITKQRAQGLVGNAFPVAPNLAVEVISDSETAKSVRQKVHDYLEAGTQVVWTVYPEDKLVEVHRLNDAGTLLTDTYRVGDTMTGGNVLPDFAVAVRAIFPEE